MKNTLREKMLNGEKVLGTFHEIGSATAVELLAYAGLDYVLIDSEHGPFDVERVQEFSRAAKLAGTTPLVRVKDGERNSILKMLDVGAMGLIIPNVKTVSEVEDIVSYGKYYPTGNRGVAPASGSRYWFADYAQQGLEHYFEVSNRETLIIPQCETKEALENIEEIVSTDGVDGIFVGPFDLSTALGKPGKFDDQEIIDAIQRILDACKKHKKFSFIYTGDLDSVKKNFDLGFDSVTYAMDAIVLANAFKDIVERAKP